MNVRKYRKKLQNSYRERPYKSIMEKNRAFIWGGEQLSSRNRQFPKFPKFPKFPLQNPNHRHSEISPRDNPDNERTGQSEKPKRNRRQLPKPEAAVTSHLLRSLPPPIHFVFSPHPPRLSTDTIDTIHPPIQASKLGEEGEPSKGEGRVDASREFIRRLTRFKLWHLN